MPGPSAETEAAIQNFLREFSVNMTKITDHIIAMDANIVEYATAGHSDDDFQDLLEHRRQLAEMQHITLRGLCNDVARITSFAIEKMKP